MIFDLDDYQNNHSMGRYLHKNAYCMYYHPNPERYFDLARNSEKNKNDIKNTLKKLKSRLNDDYYWKIYPIQSRTLDYSSDNFPAYKFILPEMLTDDWLGMVGWHKEYQRDHGLHLPMCGYIANKLLDKYSGLEINGFSLVEHIYQIIKAGGETEYIKNYLITMGIKEHSDWKFWLDMTNESLWIALIQETAYIAAIYHDIGYPWQYVNIINNKLANIGYHDERLSNDSDKVNKHFGGRMLFAPFNEYKVYNGSSPFEWREKREGLIKRALNTTHGLPGAISFLYYYDVLTDYPTNKVHPIKQLCVEWAAMAIMMHDLCGIYWGENKDNSGPENPQLRIRFNVDPMSFILTFVDQLQEFERPSADFIPDKNTPRISYNRTCKRTELLLAGNELIITFNYPNEAILAKNDKDRFLLNDNKKYFNPKNGYLDYSSLGIKNIKMQTAILP